MHRFFSGTRRVGLAALALVGLVACGDGTAGPAEPATTARRPAAIETTAVTEPVVTEAVTTDAPVLSEAVVETSAASAPAGAMSFSQSVQPVIEANCASCHTGAGPGAVHMAFDTAAQVASAGDLLAGAVETRYMPPWPAADGDVAFHDDRRLSPEAIKAVVDWVGNGSPLDVDPDTPIEPSRVVVEPIERDTVMTGEPYKGSLDDVDDYRCQVYDPKLTSESFLQGMSFEPDQTRVVHHALLFVASALTRSEADNVDAAEPKPGWDCPAIPNLAGGNVRQILSWAPGMAPTRYPADTGLRMEAGDYFIMQVHYHYSDETIALPEDASAITVDFADADVIAAAGGQLDPIDLTVYLAPAEIPCSADQTGPLCDRDAAIAALNEQRDPISGLAANGLLIGCGAKVEDFAAMTTGVASASCTHPAKPGKIVSVWGHEHELGQSFKMTLNPGTPGEKVLLDIPRWDFDWQLDYYPVEEIVIAPGDQIRIECTWDRSRSKSGAQPRYVFWSEGTESEMCYSQVVTRPAD